MSDVGGRLWITQAFDRSHVVRIEPNGAATTFTLAPPSVSLSPDLAFTADGSIVVADGTTTLRVFNASFTPRGTVATPFPTVRIDTGLCDTLLARSDVPPRITRIDRAGNALVGIDVSFFLGVTNVAESRDGSIRVSGTVMPFTFGTRRFSAQGVQIDVLPYGAAGSNGDLTGSLYLARHDSGADADGDSFPDRLETRLGFNALDPSRRPDALLLQSAGPAPGQLGIVIDAPRHPGAAYLLAVALAAGPGLPLSTCACPVVPLQNDFLLVESPRGPLLPGFAGSLDASGHVAFAAGLPAGASGYTVHLSALVERPDIHAPAATQAVAVTLP